MKILYSNLPEAVFAQPLPLLHQDVRLPTKTGEQLAGLSQFGVQLDLDARRPARITDDIREKAAAMLPPA